MARTRLSDVLQDHYFWAFDATSEQGVPVFSPLFGFSRISAPEISVDIESFKDGTFLYNRGVVKGGSVSPIVFERAASMFDADFYSWIVYTLHGNQDFQSGGTLGKQSAASAVASGFTSGRSSPRRNILVVQFTGININRIGEDSAVASAVRIAGSAAIGAITNLAAGGGGLGTVAAGLGSAVSAAGGGSNIPIAVGPFQFAMRIPGRAWLLNNCVPVRYRAANDFDANSGQVSLTELEVQPESIEEFSLGIKL